MTSQPLTEVEFRRALDGISDRGEMSHKFIASIIRQSKGNAELADVVRVFCDVYRIPLTAPGEE